MKKNGNTFWCIICIFIGLLAYAIIYWMWQGYIKAEIKLKTEATIVNVEEEKRFKKVKEEKNDNFSRDYKEFYEYTLTWEFKDESRGVTKNYQTNAKSDYSNAYHIGQKKTIYAYSNNGEDYEINSLYESTFTGIFGTVFIVVGIIELISGIKKKKNDAHMQEVIKQRIAENGSSNIMNG